LDQAANNAGFDIRRRVDVAEGFTLAVRFMQRMRHEYKKAIRRMHHPTPDGFAKPLGGENLGSSTPALRFGGKTASPRLFRGYASSGCPTFGLSFLRGDLTMRRASVETVDHRAASAASGRLASSACLAISASIDAISVILIYLLVGSSFVSSGRFKGQHRCPIDTAGS
jgi:hypothetical protein